MADDSSLSSGHRKPPARPTGANSAESDPPAIVSAATLDSTAASSTAGSGNSGAPRAGNWSSSGTAVTATMTVFRSLPGRGSSVGAVRPLSNPAGGPPLVPFRFGGRVTAPAVTSMAPETVASPAVAPTATPPVVTTPTPAAATAPVATTVLKIGGFDDLRVSCGCSNSHPSRRNDYNSSSGDCPDGLPNDGHRNSNGSCGSCSCHSCPGSNPPGL